ncbi:Scr1 family TA system antitoxin-like transcriptional regulator [Actinomadura sp. 21ATH]|uniref:Scr1 family TA system antitoxin-like transcriptional regulator n=1 Tax=Actinomadura sp. 21ATH TaxID=1735444 RepID=UPI0035C1A76B
MTVEDHAPGSTVRRLVLGGELRRLREAAGVTRQDAGYAIRASESKISRLELGRVGFKERDVADLLTLYGVGAGSSRETLLRWARESNVPGWWHRHGDVLPHWFQTYLGLEEAASLIRTYEIQFVPGIVQTPEYARAVFRLGHPEAPDAEIERRVELRMRRQRRLWGPRALRLWTVIDEAALRRPLGGVEVMREQLEYLLALSQLPNVTIQVMPFRFGAHAAEGGAFSILRFPDPGVPDVAYLENLVGAVYLEKIDDLDRHLRVMERLSLTSESPDRSRDLLIDMLGPAGPERTGIRVRSRRLPAAERARGGGDERAVVDSPFGLRILMADALGKGPDAARAAADVVTAFRELAAHEPTLPGVAERLHAVLAHPGGADDFVAALLASVREDGRLELVSCGHPAPLLLRDGRVQPVSPLPVVPPLGLLDLGDGWCETTAVPLAAGDRLLICSNGLAGARGAGGAAFPLADRAAERLRDDPDLLLDGLLADLLEHVSGRPDDEAGALVVRFGLPSAPAPAPAAGRSHRAEARQA